MIQVILSLLGIGLLSGLTTDFFSKHRNDSDTDGDMREKDNWSDDNKIPDIISFIPFSNAEGADEVDEFQDGPEELSFTEEELNALPDLFKSGEVDGHLKTVVAGKGSTVFVLLPEGTAGSIRAVAADYFEELRNTREEVVQVHEGTNLYYVPERVTFSEALKWSEEGGTLYSALASVEVEALSSGIKLLARISSGTSVFIKSYDGGTLEFNDSYLGTPEIVSNVFISW